MNVKSHFITKLGVTDINLSVIEIGRGKPVLSITCGMHGNETTGFFVIKELLKKVKNIKGTLRIIPSSNPTALSTKSRTSNIDNLDLNRSFPGNADSITGLTALKIFEIIKDSSLHIDLHCYTIKSPLIGIIFDIDNEVNKIAIDYLKIFSPEIIYSSSHKGTLSEYLTLNNIPNFAIELNSEGYFTDNDVNECLNGIFRVMKTMKMITASKASKTKPKIFAKRNGLITDKSGFFTPKVDIMKNVKKGELVGILTTLPDFKEEQIKANNSGLLIQIRRREFVRPGNWLYSIGKNIE